VSRTPQRTRKLLAIGAVALLAAATGCGLQKDAGSGASADNSFYDPENAALYAPADATLVEQQPGTAQTGPLTKQTLQLPYSKALPVADGPIGDPNKTYTFCFSQALPNHPWATAQKESLMLEAAKHPNVKILYFNTGDANEQVQHLRQCASRKVDGVLVWPQSVGPLTPAVDELCDKDMLVIGMERSVDTKCYDGWVYLDYKQAANAMAESIAKDLDGKGVVVETQGTPGSSPQILRHEGFVATMKTKYKDITLYETSPTDFDKTKAYEAALNFLQSENGKKIDAWYTQYGDIALGVRAALEQTGRTDIPIYTIGDDKLITGAIKRDQVLAAVPATPLHADVALRMAILAIEKKDFPKDVMLQQQELITKENVAEYEKTNWGPQG
jgi:ABC-type sugar transport system substrate-binding protein